MKSEGRPRLVVRVVVLDCGGGGRTATQRGVRHSQVDFRSMQHPIKGWLLGACFLALASVAAGEPVKAKPAHKHVLKHTQTHGAAPAPALREPPAQPVPAFSLPTVSDQYKYQSPFEREYGKHLARTTGATPGNPEGAPDAGAGTSSRPQTPGAQVDSEGVPTQALHTQTPPLVTVGDWDLSADAHLPLTHTHDTGAAISARRGF